MKKYTYIKIECWNYKEMLEIYERDYSKKYRLLGYEHNSVKGIGILMLYERKEIR